MPTVLTIAGFDPSSGAGITADLMVFAAHGLFGTSAITALTVQSSVGVQSTHPVAPALLAETLAFLHADLPPVGIKIGMLATAAHVATVCDYLAPLLAVTPGLPIVLDPVLRSSSGRELLEPAGIDLLRQRLLPLVHWITPNLAELAVLTDSRVSLREDLPRAAYLLQQQTGPSLGVFATGGHLDSPDDFLLTPAGEPFWFSGKRVETRATHGTGCALASAFLSRLVLGDAPEQAAQEAKQYVAAALRSAVPRGAGTSGINHLQPLVNPIG